MDINVLLDQAMKSVNGQVIEWRRTLHQHPEVSFEEVWTSQFIYDTLVSFGNLTVSRPTKTSVMARLIGTQPGKVLALRADIDALPVQEENDLPYASQNPGVMHACGHDGHASILLGAAKTLSQFKDSIKGEVRFIFQCAEEIPPGGACEMVKAGVMEGVDQVIALHLFSFASVGQFAIGHGVVSSANDRFQIKIQGKGGHSSMPNVTIDPIAIGSQVITNLQHIVSRQNDPTEKLVISVTTFHGGDVFNVIPDSITMTGSVRSFNPELRKNVPILMERIIKGVCEAHGASYTFNYDTGYDMIINNEELTEFVEETIREVWGPEKLQKMEAMMGSEDFSAFANVAPGCFVVVGVANEEKGITYPQHHPRFDMDEDALAMGLELFVQVAKKITMA